VHDHDELRLDEEKGKVTQGRKLQEHESFDALNNHEEG
jgi:hypothetical protein